MQSRFMARAALLAAAISLCAQPQFAQGLLNSRVQAETSGLSNLEQRLRTTYEALPLGESGLPEASAVRYLAQRFLTVEYSRWVHGLDRTPLHGSRNATELAAKRATELLQVPESLPESDKEAFLVVQGSQPGRGFTLHEAAAFVKSVENVLANEDMATMRKAHKLAKQIRTDGKVAPKLRTVLLTFATLHMAGSEAHDLYTGNVKEAKARKRLEQELLNTQDKLRSDVAGRSLNEVVDKAEQAVSTNANSKGAHKAVEGMRFLRRALDERQSYECSRFSGLLRSMDTDGKGQVSFRSTYGVTMKDWALLETPEYLDAVGALQRRYPKGAGPGVLIPNYITGMNSCRDGSAWHASVCCHDECELEILPRLEVMARGTHLTPKQVWHAVFRPLQTAGTHGASAKRALRERLRRLAARSPDGKVAVHGRPLGLWLHQAFPQKCRKPVPSGAPLLVDPALTPLNWERAGKNLPLNAELVAEVRAHLLRRWGKDGTGQDIESFAARSNLGLDAEIELIQRFHESRKAGGLPVETQLENALKVHVMRAQPLHVLHLSALTLSLPLVFLALLALSLAGRLAAAAASAASAAAARLAAAAPTASPGSMPSDPKPSGLEQDESTDPGETDSEVAHISDSEVEDLAKEKYSRALLLQYRPQSQPSSVEPAKEAAKDTTTETTEDEQEEATGAGLEGAKEEEEVSSKGSIVEPVVSEALEADISAAAEPEPELPHVPSDPPEEPLRPKGRLAPGLELPTKKAGTLTGLLAASTSLRPSKPTPSRKPTSLLSELLADSTTLAPSTRKPTTGAEGGSWRSSPQPSGDANDANWRRQGPGPAARAEQNKRMQDTTWRSAPEPWRPAPEPEGGASLSLEADSLLSFVRKQLETY